MKRTCYTTDSFTRRDEQLGRVHWQDAHRCCYGKVVHTTRADARKAARSMELQHRGERFQAYLCLDCGYYHVGHANLTNTRY